MEPHIGVLHALGWPGDRHGNEEKSRDGERQASWGWRYS